VPASPRRPFASRISRRQLGRIAGTAAVGGLLPLRPRAAGAGLPPSALPLPDDGAELYRALGVRPLINGRGTITVIGGSIELPEVRTAKALANQHFVQLDELMAAVGRRLGELTGAEWGMVSAGCAAAMSHATAACVAGGNPDLHVRIPNLAGFPKDEVIIPAHSRNVYDAAIRAVGVTVVEVDTMEALRLAIGPRTAMIYVFANDRNETGPMALAPIAEVATAHDVPVLVDAAAEVLTIPNVHLQRGATLVAYSGGKVIRGPQSAGLLLGRRDLVQAAWVHSAPHHGYARAMKVGREEMIGMLLAVESWVRRDHEAEWASWVARCRHIADRVQQVPGVTAEIREPRDRRDNRSPGVTIRWSAKALGLTGANVAEALDQGEPRIALGGGGRGRRGGDGDETGVSISVYMMRDGDERIVADRLVEVLKAGGGAAARQPAPPAADVTGRWVVDITYAAGAGRHTLHLVQREGRLEGTHQGEFLARDISGAMDGDTITLASIVTERHGDSLRYRFTGRVEGDTMSGELDLGEYLGATWTARRA
jgi:L-seryl-tRNA(Ser) seleniumtransferase